MQEKNAVTLHAWLVLVRKFLFAPAKVKKSSHIVTQFMGVLFCVIHTNTLLQNFLSVIVTELNSMNSTDHSNVVFRKSAYSLMSRVTTSTKSIVTAIAIGDAYQSLLMDKWRGMLYVSE